MRILIATDAWKPQVNGVVNTYVNLEREAANARFDLSFLTPCEFRTLPLPTYSEIRLALIRPRDVAKRVEAGQAGLHPHRDGGADRACGARYCLRRRTPLHNELSHPLSRISCGAAPVPLSWGYWFERWFHNAGAGVMAASLSLCDELTAQGSGTSISGRAAWISISSGREPSTASACRGRCFFMLGASPWKRTSKPFWTSICRAESRGGGRPSA